MVTTQDRYVRRRTAINAPIPASSSIDVAGAGMGDGGGSGGGKPSQVKPPTEKFEASGIRLANGVKVVESLRESFAE